MVSLPSDEYRLPYDTTPFVCAAYQQVVKTLFEAIFLVFLVMWLLWATSAPR
jgi:multidrug efflux pump subunit AcrB